MALKIILEDKDHGKVTVRNGNRRARLKRKRTGRVGRQVKKSKRR